MDIINGNDAEMTPSAAAMEMTTINGGAGDDTIEGGAGDRYYERW